MKSVELIGLTLTRCDASSRLRRGLVADQQILEAALERHLANPEKRDEQDEPADDCGGEERRLQRPRELGPAGGVDDEAPDQGADDRGTGEDGADQALV